MTASPLHAPPLGPQLKRWRALHRVKQNHAAELFGVAQSTISRWEAGRQQMSPDERATAERLLAARLDSAGDHALARLVAAARAACISCATSRTACSRLPGARGRILAAAVDVARHVAVALRDA